MNIDLQYGIGVLVTPGPVFFLLLRFQLAEIHVLAVLLLFPNAKGLILVAVPMVVIIVLFIVINTGMVVGA